MGEDWIRPILMGIWRPYMVYSKDLSAALRLRNLRFADITNIDAAQLLRRRGCSAIGQYWSVSDRSVTPCQITRRSIIDLPRAESCSPSRACRRFAHRFPRAAQETWCIDFVIQYAGSIRVVMSPRGCFSFSICVLSAGKPSLEVAPTAWAQITRHEQKILAAVILIFSFKFGSAFASSNMPE